MPHRLPRWARTLASVVALGGAFGSVIGAVYTVYEAGRQADVLELAVRKMTALAEAEAESDVHWKQESDEWEAHDRESAGKAIASLCRIENLLMGHGTERCP